ncbi:chitosanase [Kutzneria viridogrisea]|uniref:Chitosanase n=1 Tax=Kutzneria viridogrisea TaxID=47990 RepID=A0ABR6BJN4_9PSEU|nr:chitosanase [Kutzneria viridogrisea]
MRRALVPACLSALLCLTAAAPALAADPLVATLDDITAVFENGANSPQYGYIENLNDGCGYTAGWIGFCTQTGDLLKLVERYNQAAPDNVLAKYTDTLRQLAGSGSDDTSALGGSFESDWKQAAQDSTFTELQLATGHELYLNPARDLVAQHGLRTNLGLANFFDTALMMGPGPTDCDGLPKIIGETSSALGGDPASGVDEASWLSRFNQIRAEHMRHPCTPGRENDWPSATGRTDALQQLADEGNWALTTPLTVHGGFEVTITDPHD